MNKVFLSGRLVKDAELNYIQSTGMAKSTFTIAVDRNYQKKGTDKKVDYIICEMLGKVTESLNSYLTKGKSLMVEGELNIDNYEKDGERKSFTKVKVDRVEFQQGARTEESKTPQVPDSQFENFTVEDDDIPF